MLGLLAFALAWKFIAPDAPQVVAMEWKRVLESPMSAALRREIPPAAVPVLSNINFIEGIERVVWTPGLAVLEGSFDLQKLKDMAGADGGTAKSYKNAELLVPAEQAGTHVGLVSRSIVMLGGEAEIKAAIDRSERPVDAFSSGYDLWIRMPGSGISRHEFAVRLAGDNLHLTSRLIYTTEAAARTASENAAAFGLSGRQAGAEARLSGSFSRDEFSRREWRSAIESAAANPDQAVAEVQQEPRKPGVIRIYGLDEGVKEIPLK